MSRPELGEFSSIICFKSAIVGMEEALGEKATAIALTAAGRSRGKNLAKDLGIAGMNIPFDVLADKVGFALGKDGTRLCKIDKITEENSIVRIYTSETLCSAGEPQGSNRKCTFTMGAIWGVMESVMGKRFQGKHVESVLQGSSHDVFEFTPM
jgi:predicted hydrocarbon binding protein